MKIMEIAFIILTTAFTCLIFTQVALAVSDSVNVNMTVEAGGNPRRLDDCENGIDDDNDGKVDMSDPGCLQCGNEDCGGLPPPITECNNNLDDDSDGLYDEDDPDCAICNLESCPDEIPLVISDIAVYPTATSSLITWLTNLNAYSILGWGQTLNYELGSMAEGLATTSHSMTVTGLSSETNYLFEINAFEETNASNTDSYSGHFATLAGPDVTPPANPINFVAIYNDQTKKIDLFWDNPPDVDFDVVRLMRSTSFYPADPSDGELIYQGNDEEFFDADVSAGITYYYTLFARDLSGNYSSGVIASEKVPDDDDGGCPGCGGGSHECLDGIDNDGDKKIDYPDDPGCTSESDDSENDDPFDDFDDLEDPLPDDATKKLTFDFIQNDRLVMKFENGNEVPLSGNKDFSVSVDYDLLPEELKTIAITLHSPVTSGRSLTFLLRVNADKTKYQATVAPLRISGKYPMYVTILNFKNQKITRLAGSLNVHGVEPLVPEIVTPVIRKVAKNVVPAGSAVGIAVGVSQTVILVTNVGSLYDIYLLVVRFFGFLLGLFTGRRKSKPWGVVYDAVTKRPLDPAYVRVLSDGKEVADAITDLDGRYGFYLPEGRYQLAANKTNYSFPSKILAEKESDELYDNLYFGESVVTGAGEIIDRNIPLDPVGFDWNEFIKNKKKLFRLHTRRELIKNIIFNIIYLAGFLLTLLAVIITPILFNFIVLSLYVVLFLFQIFWKIRHRATSVLDSITKEPLPFSIIRVFRPDINKEVKVVVTDQFGRFYLLVTPGRYYMTVGAKQVDGSYREVYRSGIFDLKRGVFNENILVAPEMTPNVKSWLEA